MRKLLFRSALAVTLAGIVYFGFPYLLPRLLSWWQPAIVSLGDTSKKVIYLTIDDAPTDSTCAILTVLAKYRVPATFFIISGRVHSDSDLQAIVKAGHSLGHHMKSTKRCSQLEWGDFKSDFNETDILLKRFFPATYFRPPSDFGTQQQLNYAKAKGFTPILGTIFPLDHWFEQPSLLSWLCRWLVTPGGIIIMHDGNNRAPRTAEVLDDIIPRLQRAGYQFVPLPSLPRESADTNAESKRSI